MYGAVVPPASGLPPPYPPPEWPSARAPGLPRPGGTQPSRLPPGPSGAQHLVQTRLGTSEQSEIPGSRRHLNEAEGESRPGAVPHDQSKRLSIQPALAESSPGASMPVISTGG